MNSWLRVALFVALGIVASTASMAQSAPGSDQVWRTVRETDIPRGQHERQIVPGRYKTFALNRGLLTALLARAPNERSQGVAHSRFNVEIPTPQGGLGRYRVVESSIMEDGLAEKYPEIRTFLGQSLDDATSTVRFDVTPKGFHAQIIGASGTTYVDPFQPGDSDHYIAYAKHDHRGERGVCLVTGEPVTQRVLGNQAKIAKLSSGGTLRTYRLAVAATGEYTAFHGGTVIDGLSAIVTMMNRVNGIYEREVSVRMVLVANNNLIIYTNAGGDPYTNTSTDLAANQSTIDSQIGTANYDIGHLVGTGGGGIAALNSPCNASNKARGLTGSPAPIGDAFDVDYVAHEMGHQFGGNHTFNGSGGSCTGTNRNASTAYEPGSGVTIQAYAGICGGDDLQPNSEDFFHRLSLNEIINFTSSGGGAACDAPTATGNNVPTVSTTGAFTIPGRTPFTLTAVGADTDAGDVLTYSWEQFDLGAANAEGVLTGAVTTGPIFRVFAPTTNPTRTFPSWRYILNNANVPPATSPAPGTTAPLWMSGEVLPNANRTLNFRVTVRDNRAGGGGTNEASTAITINNAGTPFAVTAPNGPGSWASGSTQTVSWNVGNTNVAPISTANVRITLSTDGGTSFPIELLASTPNDGSQAVTIPASVATTQARIKVEAVGNIYFDVSDVNFSISTVGNFAPTISTPGSVTTRQGSPAATAVVATISDLEDAASALSVSVSGAPDELTVSVVNNNGQVSLTATAACTLVAPTTGSKVYPVLLRVTDTGGASSTTMVNVNVGSNLVPTLGTYPALSIVQSSSRVLVPNPLGTDPNNNQISATVTPTTLPGGGTLSIAADGSITVTTTAGSTLGATAGQARLTDSCGAIETRPFTVTVGAPSISLAITGSDIVTGNALIEPNECNQLTVRLTNNGNTTATGVSATLSTTNPNVTINSATASFPNIPPGQTVTNSTPFQLSTNNTIACFSTVNMSLSVTYAGAGGSPFVGALAQPVGRAAATNYIFTQSTGATLPNGGLLLAGSQLDDALVNLTIPAGFNFSLYGVAHTGGTVLRASANGNLQFRSSNGAPDSVNIALPVAGTGSGMNKFPATSPTLFVLWDDWQMDPASGNVPLTAGIYTQVDGTAPNRRWIIEWRGRIKGDGATTTINNSAAIIFYEGSNDFDYVYLQSGVGAASGGAGSTIGIQSASSGTTLTQFALDNANLAAGTRLSATMPPAICTAGPGACGVSPSVSIVQSGGSTNVVENGATDTYSVVLNAAPSSNVTVTLTSGAQLSTPASLSFTTLNWSTAQPVTVSAVDDAVAEGAHGGTITHSATGGGYTGVAISSVTAAITDNDYALFYAAGANGSLTGSTSQTVTQGSNGTAVTAVPAATYRFVQWSDGSTANPRTDTNVSSNVNVSASFALKAYTLTYTSGLNGAISGLTPQTVNHGANGTAVTAVAAANHHFVQWSDGSTANPRTDTNVSANITVNAVFAIDTYTLTYTAGANGSITGTSPQTVGHGSNGTAVTAVPNTGYSFVNWTGGSTANPRTDLNVTANLSVTANFAINQYTVTFDSQGGSVVAPITQNYNTTVTVPAAPTRTGYTFANWNTAADGTGTSRAPGSTFPMPANNQTLYAQWTINQYTVTLDSQGGSAVAPITQDFGTTVTVPAAPTRAGYTFTNWNTAANGSGTNRAPGSTFAMPANNQTLYAQWTINQYTVTFDSQGGSAVAPITQNFGSTVTVPAAPTRANYTFANWNTAANGSGTSYAPGATFPMPANNQTLYAQWTINQYTVTFDSQGGSAVAPITQDFGSTVTVPAAPTRAGYTFGNWNTAANGSGTSRAPGSTFSMPANNQTLYAQWTINQYTVTFDSQGGSAVAPITQDFGTTVTVPAAPTRAGHTFGNWNTAADGSGTSRAPGSTFPMPANNQTLYAQWTINTYTLTYLAGANGTISGTTPQTVNHGANGTAVTAVPDSGYSFVNWTGGSTANPRTDTNVTGNISVTANFAINQYTVTFDSQGGSAVAPITQNFGTTVTVPAAPTRAGYTFANWNTLANGTGTSRAPGSTFPMPANNQTLYAQWTINTYTLTYTAGANGSITGTSPQTVNHGANGTAVTAVPAANYHFVQWSDGLLTAARTDTNVTGNITVTASFAINTYTLTYTAGANGSITGTSPQTVNHGANGTAVTAVPDSGYSFVNWTGGSTANPRTDTNVTGNISVTANFAINQYTVTFDSQGGSAVAPITQNFGTTVTVPAAPTRAGYTFANWNTAANGSGTSRAPGSTFSMPANNQTLYAQWTINTYTLTYTAGANGSITGTSPQTVNHGANGTAVTAVPAANYHFVQWSDGLLTAARTDTNVTGNITVTASFAINTYTLTYTAGANGSITGTSPQTVNHGANGTAVTAVPDSGYSFVNWTGGSTANPRTDTNVTGNISVTANFAINQYTVTFDSQGGSAVAPITQNFGTTVTVPAAPTRAGYTFANWNTLANGTGTSRAPGSTFPMPANNQTLYAQWTINTYTLTYTAGANGSITGTSPQTVNHGANGTAVTAVPAANYHFVQWSDGLLTAARTDTNVTGNITVTASFAINTYTLTYTAGANGSITGTSPQTVNHGANGTAVTAVPDSGYSFVNWTGGSTANPRTDTNVTGNISVTANFAINQYTVTFDSQGGSAVAPITQNFGTTVTVPAAPTRAGYTFANWNTLANGTGTSRAPGSTFPMPANNQTLYAQWTINTYTLTYTAGANGSITGTSPQTVNHGANGTAVTAVPAANYHFVQWSDGLLTAARTDTNVTGNITVTASFAINTYTLTYTAGANGSITGTSPQTVNHGANGTAVTAVPDSGYSFVNWTGGSTANPRTDTNVTGNISVTANFAINQYTVTFDSQGGSAVAPITQNFGTTVTVPAAPTRAGYTFANWNTAANGSGTSRAPGSTFPMPANNQTLYAQWTINTYTLTYTAGANGSITGTSPQTVNHGANGTAVTAVPAANYHFVQWSDGLLTAARTDTNVTGNITVTASFAINTYTLTYTAGANGSITGTSPQTVNHGANGTAVTAVPDSGYSFVNWTGGSTANPRTDTNVTGNISVTANFAINQYTVTFDSQGGSAVAPITQNFGTTVTVPAAPTRAGYTFANWNTLANGTGTSRAPGSTFPMPANNQTLYAQWTINQYTVTFDSQGGSAVAPITQNFGTTVTVPAAPTRTGYTFGNWNTAANGSGTSRAPGSTFPMPANNQTLYAQWTINTYTLTYIAGSGGTISGTTPQTVNHGANGTAVTAVPNTGFSFVDWSDGVLTASRTATNVTANLTVTANFAINQYTVTFDSQGGSAVAPITQDFGTTVTVPAAPTRAGYTFANWNTLANGTGTARAPGSTFSMPANNQTLFAQWTINQYTVTFDSQGGSAVAPITQDFGTTVTVPAAPTRAGYTFANWNTLANGTGTARAPGSTFSMPANNQTLFAQWTINQYTVTFDSQGGSAVAAITQDFGTTVTVPAAPTRAGYTFANWNTLANGTGTARAPGSTFSMPANNQTLFAQWTINQYTVTFDSQGGSAVAPITQNFGTTVTVPAAPTRTGYTFANWNTAANGSGTSYAPGATFPMPANNQTLYAQWTINTYTLTYLAGANGTISGTTPQTVNHGASGSAVTAVPNVGYQFVSWSDGVLTAARTDSNVTADISVTATFAIKTYTLRYLIGANGSISGVLTQTVNHGSDGSAVDALGNAGYHFVSWSDGLLTSGRQDTNVTADITVTANFAINTYTLTYSAGAGGSITGTTPQTVNQGGNGSAVTAVANAGFHFVDWSDGSTQNPRTDANVVANITVTANFDEDAPLPADLSISNTSLSAPIGPGERIMFEVSIDNLTVGADVGTATFDFSLPPELTNVSWICTADVGASCPANGTGAPLHTIALAGGSGVTYWISATVPPGTAEGTEIVTVAMISVSSPYQDNVPGNNVDSTLDTVGPDSLFKNGFETP